MPNRLQAALAIFLLTLTAVFGQTGIRQCLCTGQIALSADTACECTDTACGNEHGQPSSPENPTSPCEDESCWLTITLDSADQPTTLTTTPAPPATIPPAFAGFDHLSPIARAEPPPFRQRPPDRHTVPLTVLFSSFLI